MTTASVTPTVLVSLLILLMCTTVKCRYEGQNISCIARYYEFEEAAITNNSENVDALFSKLYKPNQPFPYSLTLLYQVQLSNGTTQRISSDPTCPSELWMWTYSPVFLLAEPSIFNRFTLYTINYFRPWKSPTVTLTVPRPCEGKIFDFLNRMTMSIIDYARGTKVLDKKHLGYVQRGCGTTVEETGMMPVLDSKERKTEIKYIYSNILAGAILFQAILICMGTALLLQRWMPGIADQSLQRSKTYSMLWAVVTTATIFCTVIVVVNTFSIVTMYNQKHWKVAAVSTLLAYIPTILEFPVAVYFANKYNFAIPCVYLAPVKLLCCGKKSKVSFLVRVMSLWAALAVIQMACVNGTFIAIAIAAAPFPVISNVLVLLFTAFCLVHLFAVIFSLSHVQRQKSSINKASGMKFGIIVLHAFTFLFLFVTLVCYVLAGAGFSYIINIQSDQEAIVVLGKAILPAALGITGLALRRLSDMWWSNNTAVSTDEEEAMQGLITANDRHEVV